jgi:hypothetical protein
VWRQVSANPIEEDTLMMEAIQLAQQRKFHNARDVAESVLLSNPNNATAIQVNASECESRQDWAEAVCHFLRICFDLQCMLHTHPCIGNVHHLRMILKPTCTHFHTLSVVLPGEILLGWDEPQH